MTRLYARIALRGLRRGGGGLPDRDVVREDVEIDRRHLAAYDRVCGFRLRNELPTTYPHVLAFPLALELLADPAFPFPALGLVHVANRIEQARPLRAGERIDLRLRAADAAPHDRGTQFALLTEAAAGGTIVWRERSTYLHRERSGTGGRPEGTEVPTATAIWTVPGDTGRRYARVSGDRNPIHLHRLTAKALGQPAAIAHGMWTKARCLAALEGQLPDAYALDVRFKLPLRIPGRVGFWYREGTFGVHDARSGRPHLSGAIA